MLWSNPFPNVFLSELWDIVVVVAVLISDVRRYYTGDEYLSCRADSSAVSLYVVDDDAGDQYLPCPDFSKYLYFLFAPTLVYRDVYPR